MTRFSTILLLTLALAFCANPAMAQKGKPQPAKKEKKSKEEKQEEKKWKKELKKLEPLEYKSMTEEKKQIRSDNTNLQQDVSQLQSRNNSLESEVANLRAQLAELKAKPDKPAQPAGGWSINPNVGVVFKVQVGAFKGFDITKYFGNNPNFSGEVDEAGVMKYTLGIFKDYWEADKFKKYLRDMGVKGAWVVSYRDGKRVDIKEVLEGKQVIED